MTSNDVRLAHQEGYEHVEHMKRFTTHGMATDQGRIGGLVGSAILAAARGIPVAQTGQPKPRPYAQPTPFAVPFGQVLFTDLTYLPGTVSFEVFGHEVELLPRTLIVDRQEVPWKSGAEKGATGRPVPLLAHYLLKRAGKLN